MIINIRGTGGSGKSTVVRRVMGVYGGGGVAQRDFDRKQPTHYHLDAPEMRPLAVLGHYETACGGCDTLPSLDYTFELMEKQVVLGRSVLMEGIMLGDDVRRIAALPHPVLVLALTTPVDECLRSIQARRNDRGDTRKFNPKNTIDRARRLEGMLRRLSAAGLNVRRVDRDEALLLTVGTLRV